jgi:3-hydroxyacyl-[acyl-carrier-protein] dehydratase
MSPWQTRNILVPDDHPTAAGHFPGRPIVPGALLLDTVVAAIADGQGDIMIRNAKFLRPIRHGTPLQLRWEEAGSALFRFECLGPDGLVLAGVLATGAKS